MNVIDALRPIVKRFEGFHKVVQSRPVVLAAPYLCPANYWTIGYGILCQKDHPQITLAEGEAMLDRALPSYINHALRLSPVLAGYEPALVAIADFVFNLGPTRYASSTLRRRVNERRWIAASQEIIKWKWGGGRILPGLVARRAVEADLLRALGSGVSGAV